MHVTELSRKHRIINLVSTLDGGTYSFPDDGASMNGPNGLRQAIEDQLAKRNRKFKDFPLYVLKEKPDVVEGDPGSAINRAPMLTPEIQKVIDACCASKALVTAEAERALGPELKKAKASVVKEGAV